MTINAPFDAYAIRRREQRRRAQAALALIKSGREFTAGDIATILAGAATGPEFEVMHGRIAGMNGTLKTFSEHGWITVTQRGDRAMPRLYRRREAPQ